MLLCRPQGGFRAWAAAGLGVKDASDYAVSPVEALGERVGLLAGATGASLCASVPLLAVAKALLLHVLSAVPVCMLISILCAPTCVGHARRVWQPQAACESRRQAA